MKRGARWTNIPDDMILKFPELAEMRQNKPSPSLPVPSSDKEPDDISQDMRKISFTIGPFYHAQNKNGDPISKQSTRFMVQRWPSGPLKGDVFTFRNKKNNRLDVILNQYTPAIIRHYEEFIRNQFKEQHPDFIMYTREVHVLKMEFVFRYPKGYPQYKIEELQRGIIHYKTTRPDLQDNLKKPVWDALQGLVLSNDWLVCSETGIIKRYGIIPGIIIELIGK